MRPCVDIASVYDLDREKREDITLTSDVYEAKLQRNSRVHGYVQPCASFDSFDE